MALSSLLQELPLVSNKSVTASAAQCVQFVLHSGCSALQILPHESHTWSLTLSVQWNTFTTCWRENAVPRYSGANACFLFQFFKYTLHTEIYKYISEKKTKGRSYSKNITLQSLLSLLVSHQAQENFFVFSPDLFQDWFWC